MNSGKNHIRRAPMWGKVRKIHLIGIGGAGMSGIAELLLNLGYQVSGSDLKKTEITERLKSLGGTIFYGHKPEQVGDRRKIPVIPRAEMLAELMRLKHGIAVAGSHGKTTVTSMIATVLNQAGLDPTAVIGGRLDSFGSGARLGESDLMVVEADESDGSFLKLRPVIAVVTNIDREHLDHYGDFENLRQSFLHFLNEVPFYGLVEIYPEKNGCSFEVIYQGENLGRITLGMPGRHNAVNALSAIAVGFELGVDFETSARSLTGFKGVHRRFELKGEIEGIWVVDDYGHHPREIEATLKAVKEWKLKNGTSYAQRVVCVFQPHRYTRTKILLDEFPPAFDLAEVLVLTEIYPAGENPISGISGEKLFLKVKEHRDKKGLQTWFFPSFEEILSWLKNQLKPGDLLLTLGAGNIWQIAEDFLKSKK